MEEFGLGEILKQGVMGAVTVIALRWAYVKDKQYRELAERFFITSGNLIRHTKDAAKVLDRARDALTPPRGTHSQ